MSAEGDKPDLELSLWYLLYSMASWPYTLAGRR